jgi:hypothetical protein
VGCGGSHCPVAWFVDIEELFMKYGMFADPYRGDGVHFSFGRWTLAARTRWHFYFTKVPAKPGYARIYVGPFEIEYRGITGENT